MNRKKIITALLGGILTSTLFFSSACGSAPKKVAREDEGKLGYLFTEYEGYYYEDASVLEEKDRVIISYTTNATKDTQDSVIALRTGVKTENGYSFDEEEIVAITPNESGWDRRNIGGSDLIAGNFTYENTQYKYLMAYHANRIPSRKRLQIGLALSNDLLSWTKVGEKPFLEYDYETYGDTDGICNPSLVNLNGESNILLFYSYASSHITETRFVEAQLSSLNAPLVTGNISVPHEGLPLDGLEWATVINADFGYNTQTEELYLVKDGMVFAAQNAKKATLVQLAKIPLSALYEQTAKWTQIKTVMGLIVGGYTRMHSAAIAGNEYGQVGSDLSIVFTSSVAAKNLTDVSYLYKSGLHYYAVMKGGKVL